eukprot:3941499-Rhodomonas_salina.3
MMVKVQYTVQIRKLRHPHRRRGDPAHQDNNLRVVHGQVRRQRREDLQRCQKNLEARHHPVSVSLQHPRETQYNRTAPIAQSCSPDRLLQGTVFTLNLSTAGVGPTVVGPGIVKLKRLEMNSHSKKQRHIRREMAAMMAAKVPFEIRRRVLLLATLIYARSDGTLHAQQRQSQQASTAAEKLTWLADTADYTVWDPVGVALSALQASA